jgi:hypothetical protein
LGRVLQQGQKLFGLPTQLFFADPPLLARPGGELFGPIVQEIGFVFFEHSGSASLPLCHWNRPIC